MCLLKRNAVEDLFIVSKPFITDCATRSYSMAKIVQSRDSDLICCVSFRRIFQVEPLPGLVDINSG